MFDPPPSAATDAMFTIEPPPVIRFADSRATLKWARRLTSSMRCTNSSVAFSIGPVVGKMPALLTTMSNTPSPAAASRAASTSLVSVMSHGTPTAPKPCGGVGDVGCDVADGDGCAGLDEPASDRCADAVRSSGDEGTTASEIDQVGKGRVGRGHGDHINERTFTNELRRSRLT